MRWWFGRKSAAPDERPFVPAWLQASEPAGFAGSYDGLSVLVKSSGQTVRYANGGWSIVLAAPQPAISNVAGGTTVDSESRAAISAILAALRAHGLIAL
jgi:hypothetical protein